MLVKTKNNYGFTDYKTPIIIENNDCRSSYYRAHNYFTTHDVGAPNTSVKNVCDVLQKKEISYDYSTQNSEQHNWKFPINYNEKAMRAMTNNRPQFVKSMHEKLLKNPPKPIKQYETVYHGEYGRKFIKSDKKIPFDITCQRPDRPTQIIYANSQGHYKYLDPYMTTNMKDFVPYSINQQYGIAQKDNISVWDWLEIPKTIKGYGLKEFPVKQRGKVTTIYDRAIFKSPVSDRVLKNTPQFVPNSGKTTEMRANYKEPMELTFEPNLYHVEPLNIPPTGITTGKPESTMYGSHERIHSILNARNN